eukprot:XP_008178884.1 PREDICTED: zinc finger MYM-type protein 1-like [Acyrthosiphon pisum]
MDDVSQYSELNISNDHNGLLHLPEIIPNRWESRHESINALKLRFIDILKALTNISLTSSKKDEKATSLSLKKKTRIHGRSRFAPQYFDEIDGDRRLNIADENFRAKIFLPVIDTVIFQLNSRFQGLQEVTENFDFLFPTMLAKMDENEISKASMDFFYLYNDDISSDFTRQLLCLRGLLNTNIQTIKDLALFIVKNDFCTTYCDVITACIIYISLPVTIATAERSFSKLKLIKNYLRNSMGQDRLSNISILNIERNVTNQVDLEKIISTGTTPAD